MAERNPFDQFDTAPPGVAPPTSIAPSGANPFDQFNNQPPGITPPAAPPAAPAQSNIFADVTNQVLGKIREAAPNLYSSTYENPMLGAEQKAVPHPEQYGEPLSKDLFQSDSGEVLFRDKDGNIVPANSAEHVMLVGPDGQKAIYARGRQTESPAVGASRVLSLGLGAGAPAQTVAKLPGAVRPATEPTVQALRESAVGTKGGGGVLNDPAILSRPVPTDVMQNAFSEIAPRLRNFDPRVQQEVANELKDLGAGTVQDLNHASERLGVLAKQTVGPLGSQTGTPTAAAAQIVKQQIDKVRNIVAPEMRDADLNYAAARASETISGRENLATVRARGSEAAFQQKMSDQATQLLANPRNLIGFKPEEIDMLREISEKRASGQRLRDAAGWLSGKIATVGAAAAGAGAAALGFKTGGPVGAALSGAGSAVTTMALDPLVSSILGKYANKATAAQVNDLLSTIRNRSPLAQTLRDNALAWDQAWRDIRSTPNMMTLTALARSSRELSNALRGAGVNIHPAQLMRGVEGPGTGQADENQGKIGWPIGQ